MHPIIRKKIYSKATKNSYTIIELPLLNFRNVQVYFYLRRIITVVANNVEKKKRIEIRDKRTGSLIQYSAMGQINNNKKTKFSHYIIYNVTENLRINAINKVLIRAIF